MKEAPLPEALDHSSSSWTASIGAHRLHDDHLSIGE
jgi:hypothetical protein